jgi:hypothetical protein
LLSVTSYDRSAVHPTYGPKPQRHDHASERNAGFWSLQMIFFRHTVRIATVSGLVAFATCTPAQNTSSNNTAALTSRLSGASVVPPTQSNAKGDFQATLDKASRTLKWTLAMTALSGPPTGAGFYGPAAPGENGTVAVSIPVTGSPTDNGVITLTQSQMDDLLAGRWYVNVATAASPQGEIRGQLMIGPQR